MFPSVLTARRSAPRAMSSSTRCRWPQVAAACRGVQLSLSRALTSAPASRSCCTISRKSSMQLWCRAVRPSSLARSGLTPLSRSWRTSSRSFRAAASRRVTLGGKRTRFCGLPRAASFHGRSRWPFLPWASFSAWAHIFTCWARRFCACLSRSCVLILPTMGISASRSRCSAMAGATCRGGGSGHQTGEHRGQTGPQEWGSRLDQHPWGHPLPEARWCPLPRARLGHKAHAATRPRQS